MNTSRRGSVPLWVALPLPGSMKPDSLKFAGLLTFLGGAQFLVLLMVAEAVQPDYSIRDNFISDLGVGPAAPIFNSSVFVLGVFVLLAALFLYRARRIKVLPILLVLTGVGAMGVGIFPETTGAPHEISAFVAFVFGGLAAILSYTVLRGVLGYISIALGLVGLLALGLFARGVYDGLGVGGMERLIVYPVLIWAVAFGARLIGAFAPATAAGPAGSTEGGS